MKKIITLVFSLMLISSTSFAGSCPAILKQVDAKISSSKLSPAILKEVKTLRDNGEKAHKSGKHAESEKLLNEALKKLGA
jgi:hypothetical protein